MNEFSHNCRIASAETSDMEFVTTSLRSQMHFLHPNTFKKKCPKGTELLVWNFGEWRVELRNCVSII